MKQKYKTKKKRYFVQQNHLKSITRLTSAFLVLLLPFLAAGCGEQEELTYYSGSMSLDEILLLEESSEGDGICMVYRKEDYPAFLLLGSDQFILGRDSEDWYRGEELEDFNEVYTLYDLQGEAVSRVSLKDLESALPKELRFPPKYRRTDWFTYQNKWYLAIETEYREEKVRLQRKRDKIDEDMLVIDLESGEPRIKTWETYLKMLQYDQEDSEYQDALRILRNKTFVHTNGFQSSQEYEENPEKGVYINVFCRANIPYIEKGVAEIDIPGEGLPENNQALYAQFPGLKQYRGEEYEILIYLTDKPDAEEILRLFLEDGQEISFDGVTVTAEHSADGQEHKIESFEDWNRWYVRGKSNIGTSVEDGLWN